MSGLEDELRAAARALGFARCGFARAQPLGEEADRLRAWIAAGRHGDMAWMAQTADVRCDPARAEMLPGAASVIVLVAPYARADDEGGPAPGRIARYARGRDYHNVVTKRARKLARLLRRHGHEARATVDSMPVLERAWAQRSGVGFIGKNCCLIVPGLGSHVFLACVLTTARLEPDAPIEQRCGRCRLCLDACPTSAFVEARQLDARRCISYLTIEQAGPIPLGLRDGVGEWLFGCDDCQDVCPFNHTAPADAATTAPFALDARWKHLATADLLTMSDERYELLVAGSPVKRAGASGLARNAAVVLGNAGDRRHLPVLREAVSAHASATVRDAAAWAVERIERRRGDS